MRDEGIMRHIPNTPSFEMISQNIWTSFVVPIHAHLAEDDDPEFWRICLSTILAETCLLSEDYRGKAPILARIGRSSHWIRPHQSRVAVAGGFAAPYGYGNTGNGYAFRSLPQFDWSLLWEKHNIGHEWNLIHKEKGRRPLIQRITLPSRTRRHGQASVHTLWSPGSPQNPKQKCEVLVFFRKIDGQWHKVAESEVKHSS